MKRHVRSAAAAPPVDRGGFFIRLGIIAAAGLLLRIVTSWELGAINGGVNSVFTPSEASDLCTYMRLGREIASGVWPREFYYQPFYYAVFLPLLDLVSGSSVVFVVAVQCLLGAATVWLCGLSGAICGGRRAGLISALLCAISTPLLLYTPYHQNETLQTFNLALLFYLALRAASSQSLRRWALTGVVCGIAIATRGNIWLLVPLLLVVLLISCRRARVTLRRTLGAAALMLACIIAIQLPFAAYNTISRGELCGASTAADAVLALGNSPEAPPCGRDPGLPAGPMEYPESFHRMMKRAEAGVSVPAQMLEWLRAEPGAFLELQLRKLLFFWDYREVPNNVSLYGEGRASLVLKWLLPGRSAVVLSLGIAGLILLSGRIFRDRRALLLAGFVVIYWGAVALFYDLSRFRAPIIPEVAIGAGFLISSLIRRLRRAPAERRPRLLAGCGAALLCGVWLVMSATDFYRESVEAAMMRLVRPRGTVIRLGDPETQIIDHGPFTFGGWRDVELRPGMTIGKEFCGVPERFTVELRIFSPRRGFILLADEGKSEHFALERGENRLRFDVVSADGRVTRRVAGVSDGAAAILDRQRDYGRSTLDGRPAGGEWVIRSCFAEH